ncbi:MAG: GDSL-type esterase/lipase family protein [Phycisphaerae bacterium]|nr:GDSL-type esterase/lipase family protein [Phycisphaerae bacterium]
MPKKSTVSKMPAVIKPGLFGLTVPADARRADFDISNEALIANGVKPYAVFIGDSITGNWDLQAYFGAGSVLVNRGMAGDSSEYVRRRFEADVLQLAPELAVICVGVNDTGWGAGSPDPAKVDVVLRNIQAMAKAAAGRGIAVAIGSNFPLRSPIWYNLPEFAVAKNRLTVKINKGLRDLAKRGGHIYVDYHRHVLDRTGLMRQDLAYDGIHPNHNGYCLMRDVLNDTLAKAGFTL